MKSARHLFVRGFISQLISLISLPLVARIYDVEIVATYGLVILLSSVFQSFGVLKLDTRIWVPKGSGKENLVAASITIVLILGVFFTLFTYTLVLDHVQNAAWGFVLYLAFNISLGFTNILIAICIYQDRLNLISSSNLTKAVFISLSQVFLGFWSPSFETLISCAIFGQAILCLMIKFRLKMKIAVLGIRKTISELSRHRAFSSNATFEGLINSIYALLPALFISNNYEHYYLGLYYVSERLLGIGNSVISENLRHILAARIVSDKSTQTIQSLMKKITLSIILLGLFLALVYELLGEILVSLVLGQQYSLLKEFFVFAIVGWTFRLLTLPIYVLLQSQLRQKYLASWSFFRLASIGSIFIILQSQTAFITFMQILNVLYVATSVLFIVCGSRVGKTSN